MSFEDIGSDNILSTLPMFTIGSDSFLLFFKEDMQELLRISRIGNSNGCGNMSLLT